MTKKTSQQTPKADSNRQRLRAQREAAAKRARAAMITRFAVIGVVVIALVGAVVWAVTTAMKPQTITSGAGYSVTFGQDSAPVTVEIYQDYMCSYCGIFERGNGDDLQTLLDSGQMKLLVHPVSFMDEYSLGMKYSTRAANDFIAVAKAEPDKAWAFNRALYENQPSENTTGLDNAQIAELANQAGVSAATIATFTDLAQTAFVNSIADVPADSSGKRGTPSIFINGTKFSNVTAVGPFKQAVLAAAAKD